MKSIALLCILIATPLLALTWTHVGPGGAGSMYVPSISPADPNLMGIGCDMSALYLSHDGGNSWDMQNYRQIVNSMSLPTAFHPTNTNIMWDDDMTDAMLLKRSTDGGHTWNTAWNFTAWPYALLALPDAPLCLLSAQDDGVAYSTDGLTFTASSGPSAAYFLAYGGGSVWAATYTTLFRSTNRGVLFSPAMLPAAVSSADPIVDISASANGIFVLQSGTLWRSTDNGGTWTSQAVAATYHRGTFIFTRAALSQVWITTADDYGNCTALHSTNNGGTFDTAFVCNSATGTVNVNGDWLSLDFGCGWGGQTYGFTCDPLDPNRALWTDSGRAYRTTNGGVSWDPVYTVYAGTGTPSAGGLWRSNGLEVTTSWDFLISPWETNYLKIAATDYDGASSTDNGATWRVTQRTDGINANYFNTCYQLSPDTVTGKLWGAYSYVHDIPGGWSINTYTRTGHGAVCVSTDHGHTWAASNTGMADKPVVSVAVDYTSSAASRRLFAAVWGNGVWRSTDGGANWTRCPTGMNVGDGTLCDTCVNSHVMEVQVHPSGTVFAMKNKYIRSSSHIRNDAGLWKSTDHGDTWTFISSNVADCTPTSVDPHGEHSWADCVSFTLDPANVNHIYVSAKNVNGGKVQGGLYETTDGGTNWVRTLTIYGAQRLTKSRYNPNRWYLATEQNGLMISSNSGNIWAEDTAFPFNFAIRVVEDPRDSNIIWVNTYGGGVMKGQFISTGIDWSSEPIQGNGLRAYPNPAGTVAHIVCQADAAGKLPERIEVYDLNGRMVAQPLLHPEAGQGIADWDLNAVGKGVYLLKAGLNTTRIVIR